MAFELIREELDGIKVFKPRVFGDSRGFFFESFQKAELQKFGITADFVQDNQSRSAKGTIRGMHLQYNKPQGKLLRVTRGCAVFREIDVRPHSTTFGQYIEQELSDENNFIMWVPPGFANGFSAESEICDVNYKCTEYWNAASEVTINYSTPEVGIRWNVSSPIVSAKDQAGISLSEWLSLYKKLSVGIPLF